MAIKGKKTTQSNLWSSMSPLWQYAICTSRGMLNFVLKASTSALVFKRCEKPIFHILELLRKNKKEKGKGEKNLQCNLVLAKLVSGEIKGTGS